MKNINVEKINNEVVKFIDEREWDQFHSLKNLVMALSVESSELVEIFQWVKESESNLISKDPKNKEKVEDEIADIFIYLMRIAIKADVDIEKSVFNKIKKNAIKYPVDKSKGSITKYTEL